MVIPNDLIATWFKERGAVILGQTKNGDRLHEAKTSSLAVANLARAKGENVAELVKWFTEFYNLTGAPFNYRSATGAVRAAYKGMHKLAPLVAGCAIEKTLIGRIAK